MTTSGTATKILVIANGVFTASGVDHEGSTSDTSSSRAAASRPATTTGAPKVNPATCFFTFTGGGKFTASGGTSADNGISGSGKVVLSIVSVLGRKKSGACSENGRPVAWQQTYRGTARIKL